MDNNGKRLTQICKQNNLKILNGHFQHQDIHEHMWKQTTLYLKIIIDYAIKKQKSLGCESEEKSIIW